MHDMTPPGPGTRTITNTGTKYGTTVPFPSRVLVHMIERYAFADSVYTIVKVNNPIKAHNNQLTVPMAVYRLCIIKRQIA